MNTPLHDPRHPWTRLTAAARTVRDERDVAAPWGFATRVVALAMGQERRVGSLFEAFALRALAVAGLLAVASVALNYNELTGRLGQVSGDDVLPGINDTVAVVLALAD
jgi:hypothetical protein